MAWSLETILSMRKSCLSITLPSKISRIAAVYEISRLPIPGLKMAVSLIIVLCWQFHIP